jgi:FtsZ-interacting cell division protein YlmF
MNGMSKESTKKSAASKRKPRASKPVTPESNEAETSENWSADDSDGAETWTSVDLRLLLEDFRDGQSFYLEALQSALLQSMEARVLSAVQFRLGLEADIGDRGIRKIANSALSAGASGESRTREAALEFLLEKSSNIDQKSFIKKLDEEFIESYTWMYLSKLKVLDGTLCEICKEVLKAEKYLPLPAGKSVVSSEEDSVYYVHLSCDFANGMRFLGREMRSTRGAYEKQMRSIRQVLKAYYKNPNFYPEDHTEYFKLPDDYLLHDKEEFGNFLFNIYSVWSETTDVNEAFHPVYWSYLNEYAQAILEFRTKGEISKSTITKKLRKHIENEDRIESVYEYFVQNYSRSLGDTGKTASNPAIFKKISSPATPDNKKSESQKYEKKSGVLHAVIHEYTLDTREQISEVFRDGYPVVLDTSKLPNDERQKLMDFSAGLIFGGGGEIHQISSTIYLLMPEHATLLYMK